MIKKIIAGLCLILSTTAFSQDNNASPYSYYGIGDVKFKGTVENRSMGGLSILPDSIHVNLQNPAMYNSLLLTTYTVGVSNKSVNFKSDSGNDSAGRVTFDYLAVALPFKKIGVSFGLMPYTSVGYRIQNDVTRDNVEYHREFEGSGGINRAFAGVAYKITPKLSLGANLNYNFGNIQTKSIVGATGGIIQYPTRELNDAHYGGLSFNFGANYQTKISEKLDWVTSATFTPESTLNSTTERNFATVLVSSSGGETIVDQIDSGKVDNDTKMPSMFTFGTGVGQIRKWFAGIEYTTQSSNAFGSRFNSVTAASFKSSQKINLGGYYIPNYNSFNSYLSRVTYRGGLRYEKTGLEVNNQSIDDMALTLGMGLPLGGYMGSNINIGLELGRRGTTKANLVQENYVNVMISLSLNDRWFIKRKYD